jgi:hypothetical protein
MCLLILVLGRDVGRMVVMVMVMCLGSRRSWDILMLAVIDYRGGIGLYRRGIGFGNCFMLIGIIFGGLVFVFLGEIQLDRIYDGVICFYIGYPLCFRNDL